MKLTEHLYKFTGVECGTNSNIYGVADGKTIALIDVGYSDLQWSRMTASMSQWGLAPSMVERVFVTHSHFDHARNLWRANELGAEVLTSENAVQRIEHGNPEMERLFGVKWVGAHVDGALRDGDVFSLPGAGRLRVMETPGHSVDSLTFLLEIDGIVAAVTGDMFFIGPRAPEDAVSVELGYAGSEDFCREALVESLNRLRQMHIDLLCPGHYYTYRCDQMEDVVACAYAQAQGTEA